MISVFVDEGYAYDLFSIAQVKAMKKPDNLKLFENCHILEKSLVSQIGQKLHQEILSSESYRKLYTANLLLYNYIDEMKTRPSIEDGVYVDSLNHQRYLYKKEIQETFFADKPIREQKIGYGQQKS